MCLNRGRLLKFVDPDVGGKGQESSISHENIEGEVSGEWAGAENGAERTEK